MPYDFPKRTRCQDRPDFGICWILSPSRRRTGFHEIRFRLSDGTGRPERFRCSLPSHTPRPRVANARDALLKAVRAGMIKSRRHWTKLTRMIMDHTANLNRKDGIRRFAPWEIVKSERKQSV